MNFISSDQLKALALKMSNNNYGAYLMKIATTE